MAKEQIAVAELVLNIIIGLVGEETLAGLFTGTPIAGELIAALVGLIPNCASSVVITQLYLDHIIGAGAMMAGLLVNAGVGLLILFRLNRDRVQNLKIVGVLYGLGVFWGIIIEFAGIVFCPSSGTRCFQRYGNASFYGTASWQGNL